MIDWVRVDNLLPGCDEWVIIIDSHGNVFRGRRLPQERAFCTHDPAGDVHIIEDVTHWAYPRLPSEDA